MGTPSPPPPIATLPPETIQEVLRYLPPPSLAAFALTQHGALEAARFRFQQPELIAQRKEQAARVIHRRDVKDIIAYYQGQQGRPLEAGFFPLSLGTVGPLFGRLPQRQESGSTFYVTIFFRQTNLFSGQIPTLHSIVPTIEELQAMGEVYVTLWERAADFPQINRHLLVASIKSPIAEAMGIHSESPLRYGERALYSYSGLIYWWRLAFLLNGVIHDGVLDQQRLISYLTSLGIPMRIFNVTGWRKLVWEGHYRGAWLSFLAISTVRGSSSQIVHGILADLHELRIQLYLLAPELAFIPYEPRELGPVQEVYAYI